MENILDTKGVAMVDLVNGSITLNKVLVSEWASKLLPAEGEGEEVEEVAIEQQRQIRSFAERAWRHERRDQSDCD